VFPLRGAHQTPGAGCAGPVSVTSPPRPAHCDRWPKGEASICQGHHGTQGPAGDRGRGRPGGAAGLIVAVTAAHRASAVLSAGRCRRGTEQRHGAGHGGTACRSARVRAAGPPARPPLAGTKYTDPPADLPATRDPGSRQAGGLRSRYGSFPQRHGPVSQPGWEGSRKRGGRAPRRADQDGHGTAGRRPPGSQARGTSRPGQARMGPEHQPVTRQGPARPASQE
jgi:hypothetical protein